MCASQRPVHLLPLDEASAHHLVDRRFDECRADRFTLPVPLAEIRDRFLIVANIGFEFRHAPRQLLRRRCMFANQIEIPEQIGQALECLFDIAVPQKVLHALALLRYLGTRLLLFRLKRFGLLL